MGAGWRSMPASLKMDQRTLSAIYHATLRSELTRRLGVALARPVTNGIAEIDLVPDRGARRVLPAHRRRATPDRREARPVHRHVGPRPDPAGTVAARARSRHRLPARQTPRRRRRRAARRLGRAGRRRSASTRTGSSITPPAGSPPTTSTHNAETDTIDRRDGGVGGEAVDVAARRDHPRARRRPPHRHRHRPAT